MEDFEGNVARTISRYHTHMNKIRTFVSCDVYDVTLVLSLVTGGRRGHVKGGGEQVVWMPFTVTAYVTQGAGTDIPTRIDTNMPILIGLHSEGRVCE